MGYSGHDLAWLNVTTTKGGASAPLDASRLFQQQPTTAEATPITQTGCRAGKCTGTAPLLAVNASASSSPPPNTWAYNIYGLFEHHVPQLRPDYLLFNRGHWGRLPGPYDMERLAAAVTAAVRGSGGRAIFRTTTPKA